MKSRREIMKQLLKLKHERRENRKLLPHVSGISETEVQRHLDEIPIQMKTLKWVLDEQIGS